MTRKDFELIASTLAFTKPTSINYARKAEYISALAEWTGIVDEFTAMLASQNERFDAQRFRKACDGYTK